MDTSDTGNILDDTAFERCDYLSAAELAGEEGGFSCQVSTVQPDAWAIVLGVVLGLVIIIRSHRC